MRTNNDDILQLLKQNNPYAYITSYVFTKSISIFH